MTTRKETQGNDRFDRVGANPEDPPTLRIRFFGRKLKLPCC